MLQSLASNPWVSFQRKKSKYYFKHCTKNEVTINDFFSQCDQIRSFMRIRSHLLKKSLMENFIFYIVKNLRNYQIYKTIRSTFSLFENFCQNSACLKTIISFHDRPNRLICVQSEQQKHQKAVRNQLTIKSPEQHHI